MRRYRNFGFPTASTTARGASSTTAKATTTSSTASAATRPAAVNPIVAETVKVVNNNKNLSTKQKSNKVAELFKVVEPVKNKQPIVQRPPSFKPAPSPPVVTVPPNRDDRGRVIEPGQNPNTGTVSEDPRERELLEREQERQRQEEERRRKIAEEEARRDEANRKQEEARRLAEEADRQQQQPAPPVNIIPLPIVEVAPSPTPRPPAPSPAPPAQIRPSPRPSPRTSIRMPTAIPRTYSRNMRVSFRAPRLMLPKPTMRKLQPRPTKQKWKAMSPTYPSFMNRVKHGQFSFQNRGRLFPQPTRGHTHAEIRKLQNQVNKLNADALKTRQDSIRERNALKSKLRDYELSPVTQVRDHAKGIFSIVDNASRFATPSVNGMNGFPSVGEGTSRAFAVGVGLLTALFVIGRVE